jgi:hypothetical protein
MTQRDAAQLLRLLDLRYPPGLYRGLTESDLAAATAMWASEFSDASLEEVLAALPAADAARGKRDPAVLAFPPSAPQIRVAMSAASAPARPSLDDALQLCLRASRREEEGWLAQESAAVALWAQRNGGVWAVTHENVEDAYRRGALERGLREAYDELAADPHAAARQLRSSGGELRQLPGAG